MLHHFLRINDSYRFVSVLALYVLMSAIFLVDYPDLLLKELHDLTLGRAIAEGKIIYVQLFDTTSPLSSATFGLMSLGFGELLIFWRIVAVALLFFQNIGFSLCILDIKEYGEKNYLGSLIFGVLCFFSWDVISLSSELLGASVLMIALYRLKRVLKAKRSKDQNFLHLGFWLGVASLFELSYSIFFIASLIIIIFFTPVFRRILLLFFGFGIPHIVLMGLYYWGGHYDYLWSNFYVGNLSVLEKGMRSLQGIVFLGILPGVYLLIACTLLVFKGAQWKVHQAMFMWMLFGVLHLLLISEITGADGIVLIPPVAYLINQGLRLIKGVRWPNVLLWILVVGVATVSIMARYDKIVEVNYSSLVLPPTSSRQDQIKNKRILVLADELEFYRNNTLGSVFFNWRVTRPIFENLSSPQNVVQIATSFEEELPEVIVDRHGVMPKVLDKIPALQFQYEKQGIFYHRTNR